MQCCLINMYTVYIFCVLLYSKKRWRKRSVDSIGTISMLTFLPFQGIPIVNIKQHGAIVILTSGLQYWYDSVFILKQAPIEWHKEFQILTVERGGHFLTHITIIYKKVQLHDSHGNDFWTHFTNKTPTYSCKESHYKPTTVVRPS